MSGVVGEMDGQECVTWRSPSRHGIRWMNQYDGMKVDHAKGLKKLKKDKTREKAGMLA